jgi:hypothetical protein
MLRKYLTNTLKGFPLKYFSTTLQTGGVKKTFGGLKDQDRIYTNLYRDGDPFIDGALKRVSTYHNIRETGIKLRIFY